MSELRALLAPRRNIGFVPTMGALHAGHGSLIERAVRESDCVVVSVFVNPIQFNSSSDFARYPRPLENDLRFCEQAGAHVVFAPEVADMYPQPQKTFVEVEGVTEKLCGEFRPGHFRGVATVVAKLLNIVRPDRAYFGEKDAQQLAVIRRMVRDLNMPVEIVEVPTVREPDGLALSSRNVHLSPAERGAAPVLYRSLRAAAAMIAAGAHDPEAVKARARELLAAEPLVRLEYLEIVDPGEMQPVARIQAPVRIAIAAWLGSTRLIDNILA
ncbi:MAG: pantoate--beta-alanine ligase [Bryobacteraceae bacterium]